jgi:hypothetical protein
MESSRSIPELKSSFIRTQVRILSEALEVPEDWRSYAAEPAEEALSDKVVGDVLQKCKRNNVSVLAAPKDLMHMSYIDVRQLYSPCLALLTNPLYDSERGLETTQSHHLLVSGDPARGTTDSKSILVLREPGYAGDDLVGREHR